MKKIDAPVYVSDDGLRRFETAEECIEYERFVALREILNAYAPTALCSDSQVVNFILEKWSEIACVMTPAKVSPTTAAPTAPLKPHVFRELVNDLRDLAKQFHGHDSLRERISGRLAQDVPVVGPCGGHAAQQEADEAGGA